MSREQQITDFYRAYLGREPDEGGFQHYMQQAAGGRSLGDIGNEIATSPEAKKNVTENRTYREETSGYQSQIDAYRQETSGYKSQIDDLNRRIGNYDSEISDLKSSLDDYQDKISGLTTQYNQALTTAQQNAADRDMFENKFKDATSQFEAAQAEAQRYREEAVGQQLRAVRSGSTAGGANQTSQMQGSLATGKTGYSSADGAISDLAESMRGQGGLTDSVLSREGPVVQQLSRGSRGSGRSSSSAANASAGTGSYYASRFGG